MKQQIVDPFVVTGPRRTQSTPKAPATPAKPRAVRPRPVGGIDGILPAKPLPKPAAPAQRASQPEPEVKEHYVPPAGPLYLKYMPKPKPAAAPAPAAAPKPAAAVAQRLRQQVQKKPKAGLITEFTSKPRAARYPSPLAAATLPAAHVAPAPKPVAAPVVKPAPRPQPLQRQPAPAQPKPVQAARPMPQPKAPTPRPYALPEQLEAEVEAGLAPRRAQGHNGRTTALRAAKQRITKGSPTEDSPRISTPVLLGGVAVGSLALFSLEVGYIALGIYAILAVWKRWPSRQSFALALAMFGGIILTSLLEPFRHLAENLAVYAFLLLCIGTVSLALEVRRDMREANV